MIPGTDDLRVYEPAECGVDGYPRRWHLSIKHAIREEAGHRCVRCGHPYRTGVSPPEWSPCDARCTHGGPIRVQTITGEWIDYEGADAGPLLVMSAVQKQAHWRVLTVHHLDGDKRNCRWWNLAALCQRCHLRIQNRVQICRVWPWEHSAWFAPYAAGYYAFCYLGEDLTREQTHARLDELLALERVA